MSDVEEVGDAVKWLRYERVRINAARSLAALLTSKALEERAAIVKWLRAYADDGLAQSYADAIERGEHLKP